MKKLSWKITAVGVIAAASALGIASRASADERVVAHVPFPFVVGTRVLAAGDYVIEETEGATVVRVEREDGTAAVYVLTIAAPVPVNGSEEPELSFVNLGNTYFLHGIELPDGRREIPLDPQRIERERAELAADELK